MNISGVRPAPGFYGSVKQPEPEETPVPEETVSIVPEEKTAPLNVIKTSIGCQYSGSVNDEWHSVETMQDFC